MYLQLSLNCKQFLKVNFDKVKSTGLNRNDGYKLCLICETRVHLNELEHHSQDTLDKWFKMLVGGDAVDDLQQQLS